MPCFAPFDRRGQFRWLCFVDDDDDAAAAAAVNSCQVLVGSVCVLVLLVPGDVCSLVRFFMISVRLVVRLPCLLSRCL